MQRAFRVAVAGLMLLGCGADSTTEPTAQGVPATGDYAYSATIFDGGFSVEVAGTLILETASEARVSGRWDVQGFSPTLLFGDRVEGRIYELGASYDVAGISGTAVHRVEVVGGGLSCTLISGGSCELSRD